MIAKFGLVELEVDVSDFTGHAFIVMLIAY